MRLPATPSSPATKSRSSSGIWLSNSMRITEPRRRRFSAVSKQPHEILGSSSTSMSLSRMMRNVPEPFDLVAGEQLADEQADRFLDRDEADFRRLRSGSRMQRRSADRQAQQRRHVLAVLEVAQLRARSRSRDWG